MGEIIILKVNTETDRRNTNLRIVWATYGSCLEEMFIIYFYINTECQTEPLNIKLARSHTDTSKSGTGSHTLIYPFDEGHNEIASRYANQSNLKLVVIFLPLPLKSHHIQLHVLV